MDIDKKLKRNKRNRKGQLKGIRYYWDKARGIILIDEVRIKQKLKLRFEKEFI